MTTANKSEKDRVIVFDTTLRDGERWVSLRSTHPARRVHWFGARMSEDPRHPGPWRRQPRISLRSSGLQDPPPLGHPS